MLIDHAACDVFWRAYLAELPRFHAHRAAQPDRFAFGGGAASADELAQLVLAGVKRATTSIAVEYSALGEALPRAGDLSIIVRGDGRPAAIIERTKVTTVVFDQVDAAYAAIEGEGDGSLAHWRAAHVDYFREVCAQLGGTFDGSSEVICQEFRVLHRASDAPRPA